MTRDELDSQLSRLVVLKGMPGDTDAYWEALSDIPIEVFDLAMTHALKTRAWFPAPAEIRHDCDAAKPRRPIAEHPTSRLVPLDGARIELIRNPFVPDGSADITVRVLADRSVHCADCDDSGTAQFWCGDGPSSRWPWMPRRRCERRNPHGEHDWATACACVAYNPVIQRRKEAQRATFAQPAEKVG